MSEQWGVVLANSHARGRGRFTAHPNFVKQVWEERLEGGKRKDGGQIPKEGGDLTIQLIALPAFI